MLTVFVRTIIIYVLLSVIMRLMGKRQLGELEISELVITFLLSEIASLPISNVESPLMYSVIPILTLMSLEIFLSTVVLKCPRIKKIFTSRPAVIISKGKMNKSEMSKVRISVDELIIQARQNGIYDLDEVDYAILEENGKISIIPKSKNRPPDIETLGIKDNDSGIMHIIIADGVVNDYNLSLLNKDRNWVNKTLEKHGIKDKDILCMTLNDAGRLFIVRNNGSTILKKEVNL